MSFRPSRRTKPESIGAGSVSSWGVDVICNDQGCSSQNTQKLHDTVGGVVDKLKSLRATETRLLARLALENQDMAKLQQAEEESKASFAAAERAKAALSKDLEDLNASHTASVQKMTQEKQALEAAIATKQSKLEYLFQQLEKADTALNNADEADAGSGRRALQTHESESSVASTDSMDESESKLEKAPAKGLSTQTLYRDSDGDFFMVLTTGEKPLLRLIDKKGAFKVDDESKVIKEDPAVFIDEQKAANAKWTYDVFDPEDYPVNNQAKRKDSIAKVLKVLGITS